MTSGLSLAGKVREETKLTDILEELCFQTSRDNLDDEFMRDLQETIGELNDTDRLLNGSIEKNKKLISPHTPNREELIFIIHVGIVKYHIQSALEKYPGVLSMLSAKNRDIIKNTEIV
jgi:hypothetical protein